MYTFNKDIAQDLFVVPWHSLSVRVKTDRTASVKVTYNYCLRALQISWGINGVSRAVIGLDVEQGSQVWAIDHNLYCAP